MRDFRIGRLKGRFVVMWDDNGTRRRYRLAADTARAAEREARDLILARTAPPSGLTVADAWAAYQAEMAGRRQAAKLAQTGRQVLPHFGHLAAVHVSRDDCRAYIAHRRAAGRKDATIRTELGCLRTALKWAHRARLIPAAPDVLMPPTSPPRDRYLTRAEVAALLDAAGEPHIRLAILLMLTTAGRVGAVLDLTWDRVMFDQGVVKLWTSDIGPRKGRATVPINPTLMAALTTARQAAISRYVVEWGGRQVKSIKTGFTAAVKRAGIAHCTPHDLRRTAGRWMVEAGTPIEEVAQYLGHTNPNITRSTYGQFSPDHLRRAAAALDFGGVSVQRPKGKTPKGRSSA